MDNNSLEMARNAFGIEAKAIIETGDSMDWDAFAKAVDLLVGTQRIAVSGCGHSGTACMHFAHSMCCVDRPARFLSPAEAVHGGTGYLHEGDVLVVASRGGKTAELLPIMDIAKKRGAYVICVTENLTSPMAEQSDVVLPMKVHREICNYNILGSSSFIATNAVFDALAVAVMEETGFGDKQFALIHPGGAVGERLNKKE